MTSVPSDIRDQLKGIPGFEKLYDRVRGETRAKLIRLITKVGPTAPRLVHTLLRFPETHVPGYIETFDRTDLGILDSLLKEWSLYFRLRELLPREELLGQTEPIRFNPGTGDMTDKVLGYLRGVRLLTWQTPHVERQPNKLAKINIIRWYQAYNHLLDARDAVDNWNAGHAFPVKPVDVVWFSKLTADMTGAKHSPEWTTNLLPSKIRDNAWNLAEEARRELEAARSRWLVMDKGRRWRESVGPRKEQRVTDFEKRLEEAHNAARTSTFDDAAAILFNGYSGRLDLLNFRHEINGEDNEPVMSFEQFVERNRPAIQDYMNKRRGMTLKNVEERYFETSDPNVGEYVYKKKEPKRPPTPFPPHTPRPAPSPPPTPAPAPEPPGTRGNPITFTAFSPEPVFSPQLRAPFQTPRPPGEKRPRETEVTILFSPENDHFFDEGPVPPPPSRPRAERPGKRARKSKKKEDKKPRYYYIDSD